MDVEVADGVSTVRLNHPPVNAIDLDLLDAVISTMGGLDGPVVITGAGRCFSAGVDLPKIVEGGAEYTDRFMTALSAAFLAVFDHPAPVVAAINGHAIAGTSAQCFRWPHSRSPRPPMRRRRNSCTLPRRAGA